MIVILEGMERTGKSTLATEFEKRGFVKFKDHNRFREYGVNNVKHRLDSTFSFLQALDQAGTNVVLDRFHISEIVYSKFYRKVPSSYMSYNYFIDAALSKMNVVLVHCTRKIDDKYVDDFQFDFDKKDLKEMKKQFAYLVDKSEIRRKHEVDISKEDLSTFVDFMIQQDRGLRDGMFYPVYRRAEVYDFYLASPFFNDEQRERMSQVLDVLRDRGYVVYAPFEHGIVAAEEDSDTIYKTFMSNVEAIQSSHRVLAITDGKDMGTIWEAGYAYGIGKPVVYYAETLGKNPFNLMLSESGIGIFKSYDALREAADNGNFEVKEEVVHE